MFFPCRDEMDTSTESQEGHADQTEDEGENVQSKKGIDTLRFGHHLLQLYSLKGMPCIIALLMNFLI